MPFQELCKRLCLCASVAVPTLRNPPLGRELGAERRNLRMLFVWGKPGNTGPAAASKETDRRWRPRSTVVRRRRMRRSV